MTSSGAPGDPSHPPAVAAEHVFAIPAYGESLHLGACIESIRSQSAGRPRIVLGTSTPSAFLEKIAVHYGLDLLVNPRRSDIAADWNFVMNASGASLVTIAHQDDVYRPDYMTRMRRIADAYPDVVLAFSGYGEHTDMGPRAPNLNHAIKSLLCARAFGTDDCVWSKIRKRRLLNLGNPICCPSVMINLEKAGGFQFSGSLKTNLDWDAWLRLAELPGCFARDKRALVSKRVHAGSETTATIANRVRQTEDLLMLRRFWPKPVAKLIAAVYSLGYRANRV